MARQVTGTRFKFSSPAAIICSIMGCFLVLNLYFFKHPKDLQREKAEKSKSHTPLLHEIELTQIPQVPGIQYQQTSSLTDEFLDDSSRIRHVFFPDQTIDPGKDNVDEKWYLFPGRKWLDSNGNPIQAHGGGILYDEKSRTYFWYGEYKNGPTYRVPGRGTARVDIIGVGCYSSKDLWNWRNEGIVLSAEEKNATHDLHKFKVVERPKVIYNERTKKYVMWMHIDDQTYTKASTGIAISNSPTGPFRYLYSKRPHGSESRDMTLFKDKDGKAYIIYSSNHNKELHVGQLDQDFLDVTSVMSKVLVGQYREAPALFRHKDKYFMVTSGCSGWAPNEALAHVADSVLGPWETIGNPCVGANSVFRATTFFSQSTFVLPMPNAPRGSFVFMADRWKPDDLRDSRYVWLPLAVKEVEDGQDSRPKVSIFWHERWKLPDQEHLAM